MEKTIKEVLRMQVRGDLYSFLRKSFHVIMPGIKFYPNWHLEMICDALQMCAESKIKRLIINLPPRNLKSLCVSVAFPAWLLGIRPTERIIVSSYSQALSVKHATDCRAMMKNPWYQNVFPSSKIAVGRDTKERFATTKRGYYFATSIGGTLLGDGGNILIVDDPQTPINVMSKNQRDRVIDWFQTSLMSRLDDKKKGVIIIVMQRLHAEDLSGYLIENEPDNWQKIILPAIGTELEEIKFNDKIYRARKENESLNQNRETLEMLTSVASTIGSYHFQAQYQQAPIKEDSGLIKNCWIKYYKDEDLQNCTNWYISIDCAKSKKETSDYSAMSVIAVDKNKNHLLAHVDKGRYNYPELRKKVMDLIAKYKSTAVLIEDTSNGSSLIQELCFNGYQGIIAIHPKNDKITRFNHALVAIESGRFLLPKKATFLQDFIAELMSFPMCKHDDQVDSISQYFCWVYGKKNFKNATPKIRNI